MKKRSIGLCILLSIVTFGIYAIVWFVNINNDVNQLANPEKKTSGGVAFLLTLITFGIYGLYWAYKMGVLLDKAMVDRGKSAQSRGVLYLILQLVFALIGWCLMQSSINELIGE